MQHAWSQPLCSRLDAPRVIVPRIVDPSPHRIGNHALGREGPQDGGNILQPLALWVEPPTVILGLQNDGHASLPSSPHRSPRSLAACRIRSASPPWPTAPRGPRSKVAEVRFIRLVVATSLERTGRSRLQSSPPGLRFLGFDGVSRIAIPGQWCNRDRRSPCEITSIGTSCMSISASGWAIAGQNRLKLGSKAPDISQT